MSQHINRFSRATATRITALLEEVAGGPSSNEKFYR